MANQGIADQYLPASRHASSNFRICSWIVIRPDIWVAAVLFMASNFFVSSFARIARWELGAPSATLGSLCRWDCGWYASIISSGYDEMPHAHAAGDAANWPFFPLFPVLSMPLTRLPGVPLALAAVIASKIALAAAIWSFLLLVREHMSETFDYFLAGGLVAFNPYVIYGHAGYAEPLYFALCSLGFWALGRDRWIESGLFGALLSATRMVGFLFSISYLVACLKRVGLRGITRDRTLAIPLGLLLCPLGMVLFALYMYHHTGDALAFEHIHVAWHKTPGNPLGILWTALVDRGWTRVWAIMAIGGFAASILLFKIRRPEMGVYLTGAILMPLAGGITGMPRNIWWQAPFLYAIFTLLKRYRSLSLIYMAFTAAMASIMVFWWFSEKAFLP